MTTQNTKENQFEFKAWKHHMVKFPETISEGQVDYLARLFSQYKIKVDSRSFDRFINKEGEGKQFSKYLSRIESAIKANKVAKRDVPKDTRLCLQYVYGKLSEARSRVA